VKAERLTAPDRRFLLSNVRTTTPSKPIKSRKAVRFHRAVTGPAVAIVAVVGGTVGAWSASTAAQPAAVARPAGPVRPMPAVQADPGLSPPSSSPESSSHRQQAELDAFFATAEPASNQLAATQGPSGREKPARTARQIAVRLLHRFHWSKRQFRYLEPLWARESSWNVHAENQYSGAYGIPQAVPGSKMATAGRHWRSSARTQILWGLRYIKARYGSPAAAWAHELATGWY
jgi:hypothetical protein